MNTGNVFTATSSRSSSRKISSNTTATAATNNSVTNTNTNTFKSSGYASHQVHQLELPEEELPDQAFSFPMLELREEDDEQQQHHHIHLHHLHQLESFRDKFIDMDIALPCAWESMKRSSKSSSSDSQEFDFSRSLRPLDPACETPADELFSNGQLLPLQCKLKEEGDDSSPGGEEDEEVQAQEAKADSFSFKSQSGLLPDLGSGCVSPDRFPSLPATGSGDSRSSSFRSSSSYWDSGDKDSGDSSSSCRDSNGSSQDSCFEAQAHPSAVSVPEIMNNKNNNISEVKEVDGNASKGSLNWRKGPFKWKVLLGGSKRASLSASSSCSSTSSASSGSRSTGAFKSLTSERRRNHSFTYGASTSLSSSGPLLGSFFNGERSRQGQFRHSVSSSSSAGIGSSNISLSTKSLRKTEYSSSASQQRPRNSEGNSSSSSSASNRVLHKYLKMLRPFSSSSSSSSGSSVSNNNTATATATATSVVSLSPPPNSTYSTYMSGERGALGPVVQGGNRAGGGRSSVEEWRMYYEQREHDKELITCPSFIPGGLRVSSFSSRRSSTHASCVTSSRSSPNHSGVLKPCAAADSSSSMADLQSAIQGAIAHCKKSQTTTGGAGACVRQAINVNSSNSGGGGGAVVVVPPEPTTNNAAKLVVVTQQLHAAGTLASALADIS